MTALSDLSTVPLQLEGVVLIFFLIPLALAVIVIAGLWKAFEKADQPGWAAIIPIFNFYIILQIVGRPSWWLILYFIPVINLFVGIIVSIDFAKAYGKGTGFGIGVLLLPMIFVSLLGFSDAQYQGAPN